VKDSYSAALLGLVAFAVAFVLGGCVKQPGELPPVKCHCPKCECCTSCK
jgi:hypothetical protein